MRLSILFLFYLIIVGGCTYAQTAKTPIYKDRLASVSSRVNDLINRMTVHEKIMQLTQHTLGKNDNVNNIDDRASKVDAEIGSLIYFDQDPEFRNLIQRKAMEESRLGIPILFGADVIHGYKTIYPIPLAVACSWNPPLSGEACRVAAKEASLSGVNWTFSPMIDIGRDPRWGRVAEGYGEDPYTNAIFGVSAVNGYQGKNLSDSGSIAACLKHYVGYGVSEGGRDYRYTDISQQALWETYLVPYRAGINAGAATVMSAFNDISGVPATANYYTLTEILKKRWSHKGFVVADWKAVEQLVNQGVAKDKKQAAQKALMAGVDMDMLDDAYLENIPDLIKVDTLMMARVDDAVRRILTVKFRLGLFDHPYTDVIAGQKRYLQPQSLETVTRLAEESMVLLKNNQNTLPLASSVKKIALVGPMAKDAVNLMGSWLGHGVAADVETIFKGMLKEFDGKANITYAKGCDFDGNDQTGFDEAVKTAAQSDIIVLCLGEKRAWSGENASRSTISLPQIQHQLLAKLKLTGKPLVLVLSNGRPLELGIMSSQPDAILESWQPGTCGGGAIAGILSGRVNPSGKLAITFPLTTGQIPIYYNTRPSARPSKAGNYQDVSSEPLYWFGYGLSYSTFKYSDISISQANIKKTQHLNAEIEVTNNSIVAGKETVLWYISELTASISRPVKELKFFEKKLIPAGGKTVFRFEIDPYHDLSYPNANGEMILENGDYILHAGSQQIKFQLTD